MRASSLIHAYRQMVNTPRAVTSAFVASRKVRLDQGPCSDGLDSDADLGAIVESVGAAAIHPPLVGADMPQSIYT